MTQTIEFGLCGPGRHEIQSPHTSHMVELYCYPAVVENPLDFKALYETAQDFLVNNKAFPGHPEVLRWRIFVTGLTPCLTAMLIALRNLCPAQTIELMHFNRDTGGYESQRWQN